MLSFLCVYLLLSPGIPYPVFWGQAEYNFVVSYFSNGETHHQYQYGRAVMLKTPSVMMSHMISYGEDVH